MGYILVIIAIVVVVPLLFVLARSRPAVGPGRSSTIKPVIRDEPAADEPSPSGASAVNTASDGADRRLPPG